MKTGRMIVMKIDIKTGVVDFGNGLVVDPRETVAEFERKMPRELLTRIGKPGESAWYYVDSMYVLGIDMNLYMEIDFDSKDKLYKINFRKMISREEMDDNTYFDSRTHEKLREEYRDILANLLKVPSNRECGTYQFPWGTVGAMYDPRTPGSEIEIRYEKRD